MFADGLRLTIGISSDENSKLRQWSSIIGIVTAIIGNILISFALNIQRYAHIRLSRDRERLSGRWNGETAQKRPVGTAETQQANLAEERADLNRNAPLEDEDSTEHRSRYHNDTHINERTPLRPSYDSRSSSGSTVKQANEKQASDESQKSYLKSPYWWVGILLMTIGEAGNFIAYGFAPASIVSPLGVVALISNCIIAPCLLKEHFRQRDLWGVLVAVAGAVVVVLSAKTSETKMGPDDIWDAITRWEFELYLAITATLIICLMWASGKYGDRTILIDLGLVGLFGGYTALCTKGVASLLSDTLWRALTFPITYLLVFILVGSALMQIRYVNRALQRFDSTQVIPVQFVLFTISVIIGSAILYRDFKSASLDRVAKFVGGCVLTFSGVWLITSDRTRGEDDQEGPGGDDEDDAIGLVDEEAYQDEVGEAGARSKSRESSVTFAKVDAGGRSGSRRTSRYPLDGHASFDCSPRRQDSNISSTSSQPSASFDSEADSPIHNNPWTSSEDRFAESDGRRPLHATVSSPVIPTEAQEPPSTPRQSSQPVIPVVKGSRPSTLSRASMSRMIPGPLLSPLSSSLSAVVADNLRRGVDSPTRRKSSLGFKHSRSRSQKATSGSGSAEVPLGSSPLKSVQQHQQGEGSHAKRPLASSQNQPRRLSSAVGDFFRSKKPSASGEHDEPETGP